MVQAELRSTAITIEEDVYVYKFSWHKLLRFIGPGVLMSIAYVVGLRASQRTCGICGAAAL